MATGVAAAPGDDLAAMKISLSEAWTLEVEFNGPVWAYRAAQYPGARHISDRPVRFEAAVYLDVMRMLLFTV